MATSLSTFAEMALLAELDFVLDQEINQYEIKSTSHHGPIIEIQIWLPNEWGNLAIHFAARALIERLALHISAYTSSGSVVSEVIYPKPWSLDRRRYIALSAVLGINGEHVEQN